MQSALFNPWLYLHIFVQKEGFNTIKIYYYTMFIIYYTTSLYYEGLIKSTLEISLWN